jgi:hypothetical protein
MMPLLPLVDHPIEAATEALFDASWPAENGWTRRHLDHTHEKTA